MLLAVAAIRATLAWSPGPLALESGFEAASGAASAVAGPPSAGAAWAADLPAGLPATAGSVAESHRTGLGAVKRGAPVASTAERLPASSALTVRPSTVTSRWIFLIFGLAAACAVRTINTWRQPPSSVALNSRSTSGRTDL